MAEGGGIGVVALTNFAQIKAELTELLAQARAVRAETASLGPVTAISPGTALASVAAELPPTPVPKGGLGEMFAGRGALTSTVAYDATVANKAALATAGPARTAAKAAMIEAFSSPQDASIALLEGTEGAQFVSRVTHAPKGIGDAPAAGLGDFMAGKISGRAVTGGAAKLAGGNIAAVALSAFGPATAYFLSAKLAVSVAERGTGAVVDAMRVSQQTGRPVEAILLEQLNDSARSASGTLYKALDTLASPVRNLALNVAQLADSQPWTLAAFGPGGVVAALGLYASKAAGYRIDPAEVEAVAKGSAMVADDVVRWASGAPSRKVEQARGERGLDGKLSIALAQAAQKHKELVAATMDRIAGMGFPGTYNEIERDVKDATKGSIDYAAIIAANNNDRRRMYGLDFAPQQGED